jgi:molybdopterin synthase sulfur carrier subunit
MIRVLIPSQLRSYTDGAAQVNVAGANIDAVLDDLDARFPGIKFRVIDEQGAVRKHMRLFANGSIARRIDIALADGDELMIVGALSGG